MKLRFVSVSFCLLSFIMVQFSHANDTLFFSATKVNPEMSGQIEEIQVDSIHVYRNGEYLISLLNTQFVLKSDLLAIKADDEDNNDDNNDDKDDDENSDNDDNNNNLYPNPSGTAFSDKLEVYLSGTEIININSPDLNYENVKLSLYDALGNLIENAEIDILNGDNSYYLKNQNLAMGAYFVRLSLGGDEKTIPVLYDRHTVNASTNNTSDNTLIGESKINSNDNFTFIGFKYPLLKDTLNVINIDMINTIKFAFDEHEPYTFSSVKLFVENLKVVLKKHLTYSEDSGRPEKDTSWEKTNYDTLSFKEDIQIEYKTYYYDCSDSNFSNIVNFCIGGNEDQYHRFEKSATMEIDEAGMKIHNFAFDFNRHGTSQAGHVYHSVEEIQKYIINTMSLNIDSQGIYIAELKDPKSLEFNYEYTSTTSRGGAKMESNSSKKTQISYEFIPGVSKIRLELYP